MNNRRGSRRGIALISGIFAGMVFISTCLLLLKQDSLQFHTRDFNYFIEQAARLTDPSLKNAFALNIEGYNFLGLQGIEGTINLFHAIHTSYFRYTYVVLYGIFHSTLPIFIFYSIVFFAPLLYFAFVLKADRLRAWMPVILFALLYICYPATLNSVTASLRPRVLYSAAWCLVILAIYFNRPFIEKLILFCLLIGIREEGIILGALVIVLNYLFMRGQPGRKFQTISLAILDAAALGAFFAFMVWGQYTRVDIIYDPRKILDLILRIYLPLTLAGTVLLAALLIVVWRKRRDQFHPLLLLLVYLAAIPLTAVTAFRDTARWYQAQSQIGPVSLLDVYLEVIGNPLIALPVYILILLLALLLIRSHGRTRRFLSGLMAALTVLFAFTTLLVIPPQVVQWRQNLAPAELVWEFKASHDRYKTNVLVDYDTYQAFFNYDRVIVYNRLPLWDLAPEKRYYPENKKAAARVIKQRLGYAVIAQGSLDNVLELADIAGVATTEVASNEQYIVLQFQQP